MIQFGSDVRFPKLLDFNCNSFTNDCVGFLTGGSIPDYIKGAFMYLPLARVSSPGQNIDVLRDYFGGFLQYNVKV